MGEGVLTPIGLETNSNTSMAPSQATIRFDRRTVPGDTEDLAKEDRFYYPPEETNVLDLI